MVADSHEYLIFLLIFPSQQGNPGAKCCGGSCIGGEFLSQNYILMQEANRASADGLGARLAGCAAYSLLQLRPREYHQILLVAIQRFRALNSSETGRVTLKIRNIVWARLLVTFNLYPSSLISSSIKIFYY